RAGSVRLGGRRAEGTGDVLLSALMEGRQSVPKGLQRLSSCRRAQREARFAGAAGAADLISNRKANTILAGRPVGSPTGRAGFSLAEGDRPGGNGAVGRFRGCVAFHGGRHRRHGGAGAARRAFDLARDTGLRVRRQVPARRYHVSGRYGAGGRRLGGDGLRHARVGSETVRRRPRRHVGGGARRRGRTLLPAGRAPSRAVSRRAHRRAALGPTAGRGAAGRLGRPARDPRLRRREVRCGRGHDDRLCHKGVVRRSASRRAPRADMEMEMETTYDGKPIAKERPYGAMIDVYRVDDGEAPFLVLYRAKHGPDYEGDWAWTPPCGARQAGETILKCAQRELWESVKQARAAVVLVS